MLVAVPWQVAAAQNAEPGVAERLQVIGGPGCALVELADAAVVGRPAERLKVLRRLTTEDLFRERAVGCCQWYSSELRMPGMQSDVGRPERNDAQALISSVSGSGSGTGSGSILGNHHLSPVAWSSLRHRCVPRCQLSAAHQWRRAGIVHLCESKVHQKDFLLSATLPDAEILCAPQG